MKKLIILTVLLIGCTKKEISIKEARQRLAISQGWPSNTFDNVREPVQLEDGRWGYTNDRDLKPIRPRKIEVLNKGTNEGMFTLNTNDNGSIAYTFDTAIYLKTNEFLATFSNYTTNVVQIRYDGNVLYDTNNVTYATHFFWSSLSTYLKTFLPCVPVERLQEILDKHPAESP